MANVAERRKSRWDSLNIVLDINRKAASNLRVDGPYSYVVWNQVSNIYPVTCGTVAVVTDQHRLHDTVLDSLF